MSNAEIEGGLEGEDSGEFFDNHFATFLDFCLEFPEFFKFVKFHCAAGTAVFKFQFGFKPDGVVDAVFWRDDEAFYINSGAPARIEFPIEVRVVNYPVSRNREWI